VSLRKQPICQAISIVTRHDLLDGCVGLGLLIPHASDLALSLFGANAFLVSFWYKKTQMLQSEGYAGESPPSSIISATCMRVALKSISECLLQTEHEGIVRYSAISLVEKPVKSFQLSQVV
jgi:hypothetical protein